MAELTIYGNPLSSYGWAVRMTCAEKGVSFEIVNQAPHSPEQIALHPFGKIPAMRHQDLVLFESSAIMQYIDEAFPGPALRPTSIQNRAFMTQWMSAVNDSIYNVMMRKLVLERLAPIAAHRPSNEQVIQDNFPDLQYQFDVLDRALERSPYFAGDNVSLADILLLPILFYVSLTPEGDNFLHNRPNLTRWQKSLVRRPSFVDTMPAFGTVEAFSEMLRPKAFA